MSSHDSEKSCHISDPSLITSEINLIQRLLNISSSTAIEFVDIGWTSRVYLVNSGEIVFKFPRYKEVRKEYELELEALSFANSLGEQDIALPRIQWSHPECDYLGYYGVIGKPFGLIVDTLSGEERELIGKQIGNFLRKFHKGSITSAPAISLEAELAECKSKLELGMSCLQEHLSLPEIEQVNSIFFEIFPELQRKEGRRVVLCHSDLTYGNMIYCSPGRIGIIDFGDLAYRDISTDFVAILDPIIREAALDSYGLGVSRQLVALRIKMLPILKLPYFLGKNDSSGVISTIGEIQKVLEIDSDS